MNIDYIIKKLSIAFGVSPKDINVEDSDDEHLLVEVSGTNYIVFKNNLVFKRYAIETIKEVINNVGEDIICGGSDKEEEYYLEFVNNPSKYYRKISNLATMIRKEDIEEDYYDLPDEELIKVVGMEYRDLFNELVIEYGFYKAKEMARYIFEKDSEVYFDPMYIGEIVVVEENTIYF